MIEEFRRRTAFHKVVHLPKPFRLTPASPGGFGSAGQGLSGVRYHQVDKGAPYMVAMPSAERGAANERLSDLARGAHVTKAAIASSGGAGLLGSGPESANEGKV